MLLELQSDSVQQQELALELKDDSHAHIGIIIVCTRATMQSLCRSAVHTCCPGPPLCKFCN